MNDWFISGDGDTSIQGYATDISVDQGGTVNFKVNDPSLAPYRLDIYRMGYYQGHGARKVATVPSSQTQRRNQPAPLVNTTTGLVDAGNWSVTASWNVPGDATSGIYFANVTREDTGGFSQIIFIVRDDDGRSDMLFQTSDTTWQAYNAWGGRSLYINTVGGTRAQKVSYNRPFTTRSATPLGRDFLFGPEFAMVRWLEANGYDMSYSTNVDTDRRGHEIKEHKAFLSVGHDEYWSGPMRANVEAARDAGVHLAFFSGNEVYWKVRWENAISADGTPYRTMVTYKETNANAKVDPSPEWTGTWRDPRFSPPSNGGRPENALTGQLFTVNRGPGGETGTSFNVPSDFSNLRFWRNTSVANLGAGQTATLGDIVLGYEWDEDVDNGFRPAGLIRMSSTTQTVPEKLLDFGSTVGVGTATHSLTLYRASSGALVFGAGTVQWSYGLDGIHDGIQTTPDPAMRQATVNLFGDMGIQPATLQSGLLLALPSTDVTAPVSTITSPLGGVNLQSGNPVTITGTAGDSGGGVVAAVEVSFDGGISWHRADGRTSWSYTWLPAAIGPTTLLARAVDDSGNIQVVGGSGVNVTVNAQPTSTVGLVGAWGFNAATGTTATDSSSRGNHGTLSGATWVSGLFGNGLNFDGVNDWVTVADAASLDLTTGMTIEAWVKPTALNDWTTVVMKERPGGFGYALYASDDTNKPPAGYVHASAGDKAASGTALLALNAWTHLAATYDGSTVRLYVNGSLVGSLLTAGNITTSTMPLRIGGNSTAGEFFRGVIDEVRVYSRPLNEGEIRVDMSTPIGGSIETSPPAVSVTSPAGGTSVSGTTTLTAAATDNVSIASVQFLLNGQPLGSEDTASPYTLPWDTTKYANGAYTVAARTKDYAGNITTSAQITLNVSNPPDTGAPTIELRYPITGMKVAGLIPLWATAADNIAVIGVQFKLNGANIGSDDASAPYRMAFNTATVANGTYTLTAVARDAAGNLTTSNAVTIEVDNVPPVVVARSPVAGATGIAPATPVSVTFDEDVNLATGSFQLRNPQNQLVPGVLSYNAATRVLTLTPSVQLDLNKTYTATVSGVRDLAGNAMTSPVSWSFTTDVSVSGATIWQPGAVPSIPADADTESIEVGVRFRSDINGYITGIRFYKGPGNTGTHIGHVWTNAGQLLGTVTFTNETATGWQQASFTTPVAINAGITYVASYYAPVGRYAADPAYFSTSGFDGGLLQALANGVDGSNGVYRYVSGGGFPSSTFNSTNYWVDVVFSNSLADTAPPSILTRSPASGETEVAIGGNVTATFNEPVTPASISMVLRDPSNNVVPATFSYDGGTLTATLDPSANLAFNTTYTVTVSGATDAAGNVMSPATWSFTTVTGPDLTPPSVVARTPAPGAANVSVLGNVTATFNEPINVSSLNFVLRNSANQAIPASVSYDSATRTATLDPTANLGFTATYSATIQAADVAGNVMSASSWSFATEAPVNGATIWPSSATPATPSVSDTDAVELGVKFRANQDGYITGIRFYKGSANTGTHVGHLWSPTGTLLAAVTFTGESASGWQQATFDAPVPITANQTYVASYYAPAGRYAANTGYFAAATSNGPLTALANGTDGGNGVYRYGVGGGFPNQTYSSTNYWVDVVYTNSPPADNTPPLVTSTSPASGATGVATAADVTATFNEPVQASTVSLVLRDAANTVIAGALSYNANTRTVTVNPNAALGFSSTYTATLSGAADLAGNVMSTVTWSFTTSAPVVNASIWTPAATPATPAVNDGAAVELGVKFRASADGFITGIRFYKGTGNSGTHVGHLWAANGTLLGTLTFTNETATGWQQANFTTPVAVTAGQTYVASYYAPVGRYSANGGYFASAGVTTGPLTALGNGVDGGNGLYRYGAGGGFPSQSYNSTNYWVDVIYNSIPGDTTPPGVTASSPAGGSTGVAISTNVTATFDEPVQQASISMVLRDAANNVVPAAVNYDSASRTVTLDPSADLPYATTFAVTLSGAADAAGNAMDPVSWSFTTPPAPDVTAPSIVAQTPTAGTTVAPATTVSVTFDESVRPTSISLRVLDQNNQEVPATLSYDDTTRTVTFRPLPPEGRPPGCCGNCSHCPLKPSTTYQATLSGVEDLVGNTMPQHTWTFATDPLIADASLWNDSATPAITTVNDFAPVELGVKFQANTLGLVNGIRFYKGAGNTGTHVGRLWDANGMLLATATFTDETASGWQYAEFDGAILIQPNTTYVASYFAPNGGYSATPGYFSSDGIVSGPLSAPSDGLSGGNGVYAYGAQGVFPNTASGGTNYWVDVNFSNALVLDETPPAVVGSSPAPSATNVALETDVTATFSEPITAGSAAMVVRDASNNVVPAVVTYDSATRTFRLNPDVDLVEQATYTVTLSGATDKKGNVMAPLTWTFQTRGPIVAATIWGASATPAVASASDAQSVEVGLKFRASVNGYVSGISFYKGTLNTGTHVGHLWSSDGTLLASATFSGESASGWQQANFEAPVAVTAGQTYVVSYYAPAGGYAVDAGYFGGSGTASGPLTALGDGVDGANGVFRYGAGGGFPTQGGGASNYWVDVVFSTIPIDVNPPVVAQTAPAANATGVATGAAVSATFNEPVQGGSISLVLRDASNAVVSGGLAYDPVTGTVTFDPDANLASGATYTATLSGAADVSGNVMSPLVWSFTTRDNSWEQTTAGDFTQGTPSGTVVSNAAGGELQLAAATTEEFDGGSLPAGYGVTSWVPDGGGPTSVTVGGGVLSVEGAQVLSAETFSGAGVEGRLNFGITPFQYFGMATGFASFAGNYWAIFATDNGDLIKARVNSNGTSQEATIGLQPTGFHLYKVLPTATGFDFFIDGELKISIPVTFPAGQQVSLAFSAFRGAPNPPLQVDWARVLSYVPSGTFVSSVFDAGSSVQWTTASWLANLPTGTGLLIETSTSDAVDGPWSSWSALDSGAITSPTGRFIRYRVTLTSSDPSVTPTLLELTLRWA